LSILGNVLQGLVFSWELKKNIKQEVIFLWHLKNMYREQREIVFFVRGIRVRSCINTFSVFGPLKTIPSIFCRLCLPFPFLRNFCPRVSQRHGPVGNQIFLGRIHRIHTEIAHPLSHFITANQTNFHLFSISSFRKLYAFQILSKSLPIAHCS